MRKMTARQAISAIVAMPIALLANATEAVANIDGPKIEPLKKVTDFGDKLDLEMPAPTSIAIEESEDWDEPDFAATLDIEIAKIMTKESITKAIQPDEIQELPPILYLSDARDKSSRECRISGICE